MLGLIKVSFIVRWSEFGNGCGDTGYEFDTEAEAEHMVDFLTSCSTNLTRTYHVQEYVEWNKV